MESKEARPLSKYAKKVAKKSAKRVSKETKRKYATINHLGDVKQALVKAFPKLTFLDHALGSGIDGYGKYLFPMRDMSHIERKNSIEAIIKYFKDGGMDGKTMPGDLPNGVRMSPKNEGDTIILLQGLDGPFDNDSGCEYFYTLQMK